LGRLKGWWHARRTPNEFAADQRLYGNLTQREAWLNRLEEHLNACGWIARPSCSWDEADLDVLGPGPYRLQLTSVYEENIEESRHFVRYRITA